MFNKPGFMNDSQVLLWSGRSYKLKKVHEETGRKIVIDSGSDKARYAFPIKSTLDETHAKRSEEVKNPSGYVSFPRGGLGNVYVPLIISTNERSNGL